MTNILSYMKHRIGYAVFAAFLCTIAATPSPAAAAVNYLVITPSVNGSYQIQLSLSIATVCPAGYHIHRYGMYDIAGIYHGNSWDGVQTSGWASMSSATLASWKVCVAGVPSSLSISPSERVYGGSGSAITAAFTLTASNSPQVLGGWVSPSDAGVRGFSPTYYSGAALLLPDGFVLSLAGVNGAYTEYGYVAGMNGYWIATIAGSYQGRAVIGEASGGAANTHVFAGGGTSNGAVGRECFTGMDRCYGYVAGY